jgi:hypothetical protein
MDKIISMSIIYTGFLIPSILVISFSSVFENKVFAIEYNNFTSKTFGIGFQYPNDWLVDASELYITISNPIDGSLSLDIAKNPLHKEVHDLQTFTNEWLARISSSVGDTQIIQNPTTISTENLEMQTFLTTQQSNEAVQHWTFIANGHEYVIRFFSPISKFNNPENIEILDHFIKSIKIVSEGTATPTSAPLRFNTPDQTSTSPSINQPSSIDSPFSQQDIKALMQIDISELKDILMVAKESLADGNTEEALTAITDIENQLLKLQPQPKFIDHFQSIKDSIAKADLSKALQDIDKVQTEVINAETEIYIAGLPTPQQLAQLDNNEDDEDEEDEDDN